MKRTATTGPITQSSRDSTWVPAVGIERDLTEIIERHVSWDSDEVVTEGDVYVVGVEAAAGAVAHYLRERGYVS